MVKKNKKGEILISNVVFILLNVLFITLLVLFIIKQGEGAVVLEQVYSKKIALVADSAKPEMLIKIDMSKGMKIAEKNGIDFKDVVEVNGNIINVKLTPKSGYSYSFFNGVNVNLYPDRDKFTNKYNGMYVLTVVQK